MKINAILLMAGDSVRFGEKKTFYEINQKPLFLYSLDILNQIAEISKIYLVVKYDDQEKVKEIVQSNYNHKIDFVIGGKTRAQSVKNALQKVDSDAVIIHDAARPLVTIKDFKNIIESLNNYSLSTLYHPLYDTIKDTTNKTKTLDRNNLKAVTTPQAFKKPLFPTIINNQNDLITDELSLFENDYQIGYILESRNNLKVTTKDDLNYIEYILMDKHYKIGHSYDFHPFTNNKSLILAGVKFPTSYGLLGHSDADVVYHVVCESILGALGKQDIGTHFPDNDAKYYQMDSSFFVKEAVKMLNEENYQIENIDIMIYLEEPNLKNYKIKMAQNIKKLTNAKYVNVKATTMEKKGLVGNKEGIASEAVILIKK